MRRRSLVLLVVAFCCTGGPGVAATLTAGDTKLETDRGQITITKAGREIVRLTSIEFNYAAGDWEIARSDQIGSI